MLMTDNILKADSADLICERLLIFELNSQSTETPPLHPPEAWLAGIVYGSVQKTQFVFPFTEPGHWRDS